MSECYKNFFFFNDSVIKSEDFDDTILEKGKSLYDVIRVKNSIPLFLEKYLIRINRTAKLENVKLWMTDDEIIEKILKLIELNKVEEDSLKLVFSFNNDYCGDHENIFLAYMMVNNAPTNEQFLRGVDTISFSAERNNPHAKVFNYKLRLATSELIKNQNIYEVVLVDKNQNITEGSRSNIFFIKNEIVYTTLIDSVLPGITRENIIDICKKNQINIFETKIEYNQLKDFDSVFMTGTSRKVLPVNKIDNFYFDVNNKTLRTIQNLYNQEIENYICKHIKE